MTPYAISQMSDEEVSAHLNSRWELIIALLAAAGGEVRVNERLLFDIDLGKSAVESHRDYRTDQIVYRLTSM